MIWEVVVVGVLILVPLVVVDLVLLSYDINLNITLLVRNISINHLFNNTIK